MSKWSLYPSLYEINTWVWLAELRSKYGRVMDLGSVPAAEWDQLAALGLDAVWFLGVWERSPAGIAIANRDAQNLANFRQALRDFRDGDNVGSAYCVRRYEVAAYLGGPQGLAHARQELAKRGVRLILDFVPNHVAQDHPWVTEYPEYFVQGTAEDLRNDPGSYAEVSGRIFACGKDPYFPAWQDVLQLNAFAADLRRAAITTLSNIAQQCDGVRCDMAMLLLNAIFQRTWGARAGSAPPTDYWRDVIPAVKKAHPRFLFIAEAYWDLEWELQQQGFDFCYDKRLYDRLAHGDAASVRQHLGADLAFQAKLLRFLENHDEPRAASLFSLERERAAAVVTSTLPGARLFHEGQFEGRRVRLPVFLARRPNEPVNPELQLFYSNLLKAIDNPVFRNGEWRLCECSSWPDNRSFENLVAWSWIGGSEEYLIVANLSDRSAQARVSVRSAEKRSGPWLFNDLLSGAKYEREGDELAQSGIYVDLPAWGYHFLQCVRKEGTKPLVAKQARI
jgi:hypothetical protein